MGAFFAVSSALFLHLRDDSMNRFLIDMLGYVYDVQQSWMANWGQCGIRLRQVLEEHIPEDIGLVQDRCFVSVTYRNSDGINVHPWMDRRI